MQKKKYEENENLEGKQKRDIKKNGVSKEHVEALTWNSLPLLTILNNCRSHDCVGSKRLQKRTPIFFVCYLQNEFRFTSFRTIL